MVRRLRTAAVRIVLPLFKKDMKANSPAGTPTRAIQLEWGQPGVKIGQ